MMVDEARAKMQKGRQRREAFFWRAEDHQRLADAAAQTGQTLSDVIRTAVSGYLDAAEEKRFSSRLKGLEDAASQGLREARKTRDRMDELYAQNRAQEREAVEREAAFGQAVQSRLAALEEAVAALSVHSGNTLMLAGAMALADPKIRATFQKITANPAALMPTLMRPATGQ